MPPCLPGGDARWKARASQQRWLPDHKPQAALSRLCPGGVGLRWPPQSAGSSPHRAAGRHSPAAGLDGQPCPPADQPLDGRCPGRSACAVNMCRPSHKVNAGTAAPPSSMSGGSCGRATWYHLLDSLMMAGEGCTARQSCSAAAGSLCFQKPVHGCRCLQQAVPCHDMHTRG